MAVIMVVTAIVHGIVYADQDGLGHVAEVVCKLCIIEIVFYV